MRGSGLLFGLFFGVVLLATFPLRALTGLAGLSDLGLSARAVQGSIWHGRLEEAEVGGVPLGTVRVRLAPLALLVGKAKLLMTGEGTTPLRGAVYTGFAGFGADIEATTLPLGAALSPLPPASLTLTDAHFAFAGSRCSKAEGQVQLTLEAAPEGLEFGKVLIGSVRCDGDAIAASLTGASGLEKIMLQIKPDGHYVATIIVSGVDAQAGIKIGALGFRQTAAGYVRRVEGIF